MTDVAPARKNVVSSFTIIKGSLCEESYQAFGQWDFAASKFENIRRIREDNVLGLASSNWARDVGKVLNRRFDPEGRDRPLVSLAQRGLDPADWNALLLFHLTRDEFLVRDFLCSWLAPRFHDGTYRIRTSDVVDYLHGLKDRDGIVWQGSWSEATTDRVASGLLRMGCDFGLLAGTAVREFCSFHLSDACLLYVLHAMLESGLAPRRVVQADDWSMYLMQADDVERELLRLHQHRLVHYQRAGSVVELRLPHASLADYAKEMEGV